ncbi:MAG: efflux RND transporter permease subunit [Gammaproteobacteria bacterium]|nr:MAG: efflux RND transporter permease subunit [Gammaproteobacteria bacterium]
MLDNHIAALVAVLLVILFGIVSLTRLPIQLTPEVQRPTITINTGWRAAAPEEVEAEIIEPQEKVLRGLPGMTELESNAQRGRGRITITFAVGSDLERGLIEILNRLNRVTSYPDDADEPRLSTVGIRSRAVAWFIIRTTPDNPRDIESYRDYLEEVVQTRFERVAGVARSELRGGREREVRITFDPYKAASRGIELPVIARLAGGNEDISAGDVDVGKRSYTLRYTGAYDVAELGGLVLDWREGRPVYLADIADIKIEFADRDSFVINKAGSAIAINAHRESGANVLEVMAGLQQATEELRNGPLNRAGLTIEQVYDATVYIYRSLQMLGSNLMLGILLAIVVLWWFVRRLRATLLVAFSIPVSLIFSFIVLYATGHTINVISIAGLAFAVGMVLDASIVVLENIVRLREDGMASNTAAAQAPAQVQGALIASTATTVAIFLPVVFLPDEAGQLFADLALTIAFAVVASMLVALLVLPTLSQHWLQRVRTDDPHTVWWDSATAGIMRLTGNRRRRVAWITGLVSVPILLTALMHPDADYLPEGNRNLVFTFIQPPPGMNLDHVEKEMGQVIAQRLEPYVTGEMEPVIQHYFFVAYRGGVFMGARAKDESRVRELVPVINEVIRGFPDTRGFAQQRSLFGGRGGRRIEMDLQSRNLDSLLDAARLGEQAVLDIWPTARVRPIPGLELAEPELQLVPNERRIAEAGWDRATIATIVRALGDGLFVGEYFDGEETLDIIVRAKQWRTPEELAVIPMMTPKSGMLPINELVDLVRTAGPDQLRRIDRRRTITLQITPPDNVSLEQAIETLRTEVEPQVRNNLPTDGYVQYSGAADKLEQALVNMSGSFILAILILYLLMSALFRSFRDSLLVLLVLPLATVGSVVALKILNWVTFQAMDLLTMIGFIILLGLVVNNAILLVYQTRAAERTGMVRRDAVEQAVRLRLRPILMTTLTSVFGMLPLLLVPGPGTELYRGLATVIVGGMLVSTIFTLLLLPALLQTGRLPQTTRG